jgi:purine-binding chemotaxis protein CheW
MEPIMSSSASDPRGADEARIEHLTFFIRGEEYAVDLQRVREVIEYDTVTRVPQLPPAIRGVTNLRGAVLPVVDLAMKFHGAETPIDRRTCVVLVEPRIEGSPGVIGLITEAVGQVLSLGPDEIVDPPTFAAPIRTEFLRGMGRVGKKFALILDIDQLLTATELLSANLAETTAAPSAAAADEAVEDTWTEP